jgi:hypothetical protein
MTIETITHRILNYPNTANPLIGFHAISCIFSQIIIASKLLKYYHIRRHIQMTLCNILNGKQALTLWTWCMCDRASIEPRCKQPARCNKFRLLIFLISPTCIGRQVRPSTGALEVVPSEAQEHLKWFHLNHVTGRQQCQCIVPKSVYTVKRAPVDGRICLPKHVGLIKKINKRNLLHLVGCLYRNTQKPA